MDRTERISVWFFIGLLLLMYGIIIAAQNVYDAVHPVSHTGVVLGYLHFGIWWGILLIVIGSVYSVIFRPHKTS